MARRVFFSFYYERDIWRVNQVRQSWVTKDRETAGFWDASLWEKAKKMGDAAIKKMIDDALRNTSVTVVLIGAETAHRTYVRYEITKSYEKGNGLLGVYIHNLKDPDGKNDTKGSNPFDFVDLYDENGKRVILSSLFPTYDWVNDNGYSNFADWVEAAAMAQRR
jgi:hypothetical protein